jgi:hypothetical protein
VEVYETVQEDRKCEHNGCTTISCRRIVGPVFFDNTIYSELYTNIVHEFLEQLTEEEIAQSWFQQDGTTCQTARATMRHLLFRDRII